MTLYVETFERAIFYEQTTEIIHLSISISKNKIVDKKRYSIGFSKYIYLTKPHVQKPASTYLFMNYFVK